MPVYFPNGAQVVSALAFGAAYKKAIALQANGDVLFLDRPDDPDLTVETIQWTAAGGLTFVAALTFSNTLTIALGTITTDKQNLSMTATWNSAGVTFTALKLNVTDTASAAASLLVDLQVGGVSKVKADKTGLLTLASALPVGSGGTGLASGTSGGILGYTASGTLAASVALTANALVLGGGAGATPTPLGSLGTTTTVLHGNAVGAPSFGAVSLTTDASGVLQAAQFPALTGDITTPGASLATTLKNTGPGATGPIGSATVAPVITIDAQGRVTALTSATISAGPSAATQAEMEAASSTTVYVSPGRIKYDPATAKVVAQISVTGGIPSLTAGSVNVSSLTDQAVGDVRLNLTTAFGDNNYSPIASIGEASSLFESTYRQSTSIYGIQSRNDAGTLTDPTFYFTVAFGKSL